VVRERKAVAAARLGARTVLDPAPPRPLPDEIYPLVNVIRPNAGEAQALTGIDVRDRASARRSADVLISRGVWAAAVQAGSEGNLVVSRDDETRNAGRPPEPSRGARVTHSYGTGP
jgi:ribokinase